MGVFDATKKAMTPSRRAWRSAVFGLAIITVIAAGSFVVGMVLPDYTQEKALAFGAFLGFLLLIGFGAALGHALLGAMPWVYKMALAVCAPILFFLGPAILGIPNGLILSGLVIVLVTLFMGGLGGLTAPERSAVGRLVPALFMVLGAAGLGGLVYAFLALNEEPNPWMSDYAFTGATVDAPNPGIAGAFDVQTFAYGSGEDRHRPSFGDAADWSSQSVDGSKLIDGFKDLVAWSRKRFWGFEPSALPVQGRVWAPEGGGPFPLVLIVHGNHSMEDFSDEGYAYLGNHLASRGYILVSVDQNFLNSSLSDRINPRTRGLREENDARGWLLLEHLRQWSGWNETQGHPFFGRVDMGRIGLIGHSRGGEAVATAALFNRLGAYPDDATLTFDYGFDIGAVIAIAPVDGQYKPRDEKRPLTDVNYFTVHGGMDGDVRSFMGSSQYSRLRFSGEERRYKASLYVAGANHGQFNTGWGRTDLPAPFHFFLDKSAIMDGEAQRQIAKVYFTAFLDATLQGDLRYLPLFADARRGAAWLPDQFYINNFQSTSDVIIADFEEDLDPTTTALARGRILGENLTKWREAKLDLKWNSLDTHGALIAWDGEVNDQPAVYRIQLGDTLTPVDGRSVLRFAAAQADTGTKPEDWEEDAAEEEDGAEDDKDTAQPLDWTVTLQDAAGETASLPLSADAPLYPQFKTNVVCVQRFADDDPSEIVLRRFSLPLSSFLEENIRLDVTSLREVRFTFDRSDAGAIVVDDIGFAPDL